MSSIQRFIIIDDDESNNHLCSYIIQKVARDLEVIQFVNPLEALRYIGQHYHTEQHTASTIMLLDIKMPEISGWEFIERYKELNIHAQKVMSIYILTSSESIKDVELAKSNSYVRNYVQKPLTAGTVQNILAGLI